MKAAHHHSIAMDPAGEPRMSIGTLGREMISQAVRDKDIRDTLLNLGIMEKEKAEIIVLRLKQCNIHGFRSRER